MALAAKPKSIPEKFGLTPDMKSLVVNQPADYEKIMNGWKLRLAAPSDKLDFVHLFVENHLQLIQNLPSLKDRLQPKGMIWVSWRKKSSGQATDVSYEEIRDLAMEVGLVDVKVCAVSPIWSGLKLVIPVSKR